MNAAEDHQLQVSITHQHPENGFSGSRPWAKFARSFVMCQVILMGLFGLLMWIALIPSIYFMSALPVSKSTLKQFRLGMTQTEVIGLLGESPEQISEVEWIYSKSSVWKVLVLKFDSDGKLKNFYIDD